MDDPAYILTMDTIIYFYQKKGIAEPQIEPVGQKTYMLVRVGLDVGREEWFGLKVGSTEVGTSAEERGLFQNDSRTRTAGKVSLDDGRERSDCGEGLPEDGGKRRAEDGRWGFSPLRFLWERYTDHRERKKAEERRLAAEAARRRLEAERQERLKAVGESVRELSREVLSLAADARDCFLVFEDSLRRCLTVEEAAARPQESRESLGEVLEAAGEAVGPVGDTRREVLPILWRESFPLPEFARYTDDFWVELLCAEAVLPHFVVLGGAPCLFPLLRRQAHRMKSLCWILMEKDAGQELLDFVEDFYEEYGLAVTLQLFDPHSLSPWRTEGAAAMRRLGLKEGPGANIFDFTQEPCIAVSEAAPGSIWLDMMSVEEKRRRIQAKGVDVAYFSLKTKWRRAQKRCNCPVLP